jgi:signal transduction histidine kinase
METLLWHVTNRTAETLLIFSLFHLLLAGLVLMVLVHQRINRGVRGRPERLLTIGFAALVAHFALRTAWFAAAFFLREQLHIEAVQRCAHALLVAGVLAIVAGYLDGAHRNFRRLLIAGSLVLLALVAVDFTATAFLGFAAVASQSWDLVASDALAFLALLAALRSVLRGEIEWNGRTFRAVALATLAFVFVAHALPLLARTGHPNLVWNLREQLVSVSLFSFAWVMGERSQHLLDRVFVRLNLTFLILASLIMMITAGMEKYQYFRLAEQRSVNLAEFLRGHYLFYNGRGEDMRQILDHPEVLRRVVTEFGSLPELREVDVYAQGQRAAFRYLPDWEVKETISPSGSPPAADLHNSFRMIRLPINNGSSADRIELIGTLDYVNAYIGKYIIFIYCSFTLMLAMGTVIIGMIVLDADRQLRRRYEELQETQQRLAQAAKLASIGELAGGMAHEINNPITGILALSSHMASSDTAAALTPRDRKNLNTIVRQAERVANLVGGLLSFSRQSQLHISDIDARDLLDTALDLVQFRLDAASILVRRQFPAHLPPVQGDVSRLTEVFVNLFSNAADAMPNGGTLTVRALHCAEDGTVSIEVQDTGCGIDAEALPRIFDPFFTTKAPGRGTGLGLSISHGILKDHGGEIWARSEPGEGTTIVVALTTGALQYETARAGD